MQEIKPQGAGDVEVALVLVPVVLMVVMGGVGGVRSSRGAYVRAHGDAPTCANDRSTCLVGSIWFPRD